MKRNPLMKVKVRRARCEQVIAILCNRLETVELIREEVHPRINDFAEDPLEVALVRWYGLEVVVPLDCVVFLDHQPYAERSKKWGLQLLAMAGRHSKRGRPKRVSRKRTQKPLLVYHKGKHPERHASVSDRRGENPADEKGTMNGCKKSRKP